MLSDPVTEFDRQVDVLFERVRKDVFRYDLSKLQLQTAELRSKIIELDATQHTREGNIPVVIVFKMQVAPYNKLLSQLHHKGREGYIEMTPKNPEDFLDIHSHAVPEADIYVLWDVDTGKSMLNISHSDSVDIIEGKGRTPLTMYEGVQCVLAIPEILTDKQRFNAIQMPGSRIDGDQRVPSIWISKGAPRLGWCWFWKRQAEFTGTWKREFTPKGKTIFTVRRKTIFPFSQGIDLLHRLDSIRFAFQAKNLCMVK